jgi:hypothetical protein
MVKEALSDVMSELARPTATDFPIQGIRDDRQINVLGHWVLEASLPGHPGTAADISFASSRRGLGSTNGSISVSIRG